MDPELLERWKRAVIHIEGMTILDKTKFEELKKRYNSKRNKHQELASVFPDFRLQGTALFLSHNSNKYLLTARHVVFDKIKAEDVTDHKEEQIFDNIFRVPSLNEIDSEDKLEKNFVKVFSEDPEGHEYVVYVSDFLMSLNVGSFDMRSYTFSDSKIDLAIISLHEKRTGFADNLLKVGYQPISSQEIINEPTNEGADIVTVGYPFATANLKKLSKTHHEKYWSSAWISLPIFSFGKVSMLNEELEYFWADMSIYPGNSGGPVIENDKLVGIVSKQPTIKSDSHKQVKMRIPFGKIIKAKHVLDLLQIQEKKDQKFIEKYG